jgi:hypothetical protein
LEHEYFFLIITIQLILLSQLHFVTLQEISRGAIHSNKKHVFEKLLQRMDNLAYISSTKNKGVEFKTWERGEIALCKSLSLSRNRQGPAASF